MKWVVLILLGLTLLSYASAWWIAHFGGANAAVDMDSLPFEVLGMLFGLATLLSLLGWAVWKVFWA